MIRKALKYLFPPLRNRQKLPLLPLAYSSDAKSSIPEDLQGAVIRLKLAAVARTDHDALQLLKANHEMTVKQIIDAHKRVRRRENKWKRAGKRLLAKW